MSRDNCYCRSGSTGKMAHMGKYNNDSHVNDKVVNIGFRFFCIKQCFIQKWEFWDVQRHLSAIIAAPAILTATYNENIFQSPLNLWNIRELSAITHALKAWNETRVQILCYQYLTGEQETVELCSDLSELQIHEAKSHITAVYSHSLSDQCITWEVWKGKFYPVTGHEGTEVEKRYSCTSCSTSLLDDAEGRLTHIHHHPLGMEQ